MRLTPLKRCRFERGVMQMVLAKRAAIAWGRLSAIENGVAEAQPDELTRIAAALQVPIEALLEPMARSARPQLRAA
jgi:transcriptional regulator with XRE-family HTH domain